MSLCGPHLGEEAGEWVRCEGVKVGGWEDVCDVSVSIPALQWVTIGPPSGLWKACTLRTMASMAVAYWGTPWSGHDVKWN